jgi:hypothetical protein
MSVDQIPSGPRSTISLTIFVALIVAGFAILHVIGGTIVERHSPGAPPTDGAISAIHGD